MMRKTIQLKYKSFAKLNLYLKVLGYDKKSKLHKLSMINTEITLCDNIYLELVYPGSGLVEIDMMPDFSIQKENNLIFKAVKAFIDESKLLFDAIFKVEKNIPQGSGLGGGSSNASYTLLTLNNVFKQFSIGKLEKIAFSIGSDAPFFIYGGLCEVKGSGEIVKPIDIPNFENYIFVIIKPSFSLSTKKVYEKYDSIQHGVSEENISFILPIHNDLYEASRLINPEIEKIVSLFKETKATFSSMTGSGSSCFAGFQDENTALSAYSMLKGKYKNVFLAKPKLSRNLFPQDGGVGVI